MKQKIISIWQITTAFRGSGREEERTLITEKMKQLPTQNPAAYARKMLIDGYIILLDTAEIKTHFAQLQKIGVNINQIAKRINETDYIYADDMNELKELMSEVWKLERRLLLQFKNLVKNTTKLENAKDLKI